MPDMGSGEMGTPTKTTKTSTPQEQTPTTTSAMPYPEWAAAFQAYYSTGMSPLPPPGYFPSTMGSGPQPHPYMWGAQPLMPPYGTPPPYATMYPHGGIYAHPPMTPVSASVGTDAEGKSTDANTKKTGKRSKGSLGNLGLLTAKTTDTGKANAESMNGVLSHSGDSGSEGSTDASEGNSQDGSQEVRKSSFDQAASEAPNSHVVNSAPYGSAQVVNYLMGNHTVAAMPISSGGKQVVGAGPLTNLNIGMDYWSGGTPSVLAAAQGKRASAGANTTALIPSSSVVPGELWLQDERELKRQRRKQSNRESARRSRLRKQAECEELATRVERLRSENASLREELNRMTEECKKLSAENSSLMDQLHLPRSEGLNGDLEKMNTNLAKQEVLGEGMQLDQDSL